MNRTSYICAQMPESLALGAAGGSASTLLLSFLSTLLEKEALPRAADCFCPQLRELDWDFDLEHPQFWIFIAGLVVGLCIGPLLDVLWIVRNRWQRFVWSRLGTGPFLVSRPYHKVLS